MSPGGTHSVGLRPHTRCRVALLFIILYFLLTSSVCRRRRYFRRLPPGSLAPTAAVIVVCAPLYRRRRRRRRLVNRNGPSHPSPPPPPPPPGETGPLPRRSRVCRRRNGCKTDASFDNYNSLGTTLLKTDTLGECISRFGWSRGNTRGNGRGRVSRPRLVFFSVPHVRPDYVGFVLRSLVVTNKRRPPA